jgi:hypothetical protein
MAPFITNPYRFGVPATEFESMYESFNPLTTINKQHFVEWFSGKQLPSYWTFTDEIGVGGSGAMSDSVDGGYVITPAGVLDANSINFNDKRQYAHNGSVVIAVIQKVDVGGRYRVGFGDDGNLSSNTINKASSNDVSTFIYLETANGTSSSDTDSDITANTTTAHVHKIETKTSSVELSLDGILKVTITGNIPLLKMQPAFFVRGGGGAGNQKSLIRYMECYNT